MNFEPKTESQRNAVAKWTHMTSTGLSYLHNINFNDPFDMRKVCVINNGKIETPFWNEELMKDYDPVKNPMPHLKLLEEKFNTDFLDHNNIYIYDHYDEPKKLVTSPDTGSYEAANLNEQEAAVFNSPEQTALRAKLIPIEDLRRRTNAHLQDADRVMDIYRTFYGRVRPTREEVDQKEVKSYAEEEIYNGFGSIDAQNTFDAEVIAPFTEDQFVSLAILTAATTVVSKDTDAAMDDAMHNLTTFTDTLTAYRPGVGVHNKIETARNFAKEAMVGMAANDYTKAGKLFAEGLTNYALYLRNVETTSDYRSIGGAHSANAVLFQGYLDMLGKDPELKKAAVTAGLTEDSLTMLKSELAVHNLDLNKNRNIMSVLNARTMDQAELRNKMTDILADQMLMKTYAEISTAYNDAAAAAGYTKTAGKNAEFEAQARLKHPNDEDAVKAMKTALFNNAMNIAVCAEKRLVGLKDFERTFANPEALAELKKEIMSSEQIRSSVNEALNSCGTLEEAQQFLSSAKYPRFFRDHKNRLHEMTNKSRQDLIHAASDPQFANVMKGVDAEAFAAAPKPVVTAEFSTYGEQLKCILDNFKTLNYTAALKHFNLEERDTALFTAVTEKNFTLEDIKKGVANGDGRFKILRGHEDAIPYLYHAAKIDAADAERRKGLLPTLLSNCKVPQLKDADLEQLKAHKLAGTDPAKDPFLTNEQAEAQKQFRQKMIEDTRKNAMDHTLNTDGAKQRFAITLKQKPGLTEAEKNAITALDDGTPENTLKLAKMYLQETVNIDPEELKPMSVEKFYGPDHDKHAYYGALMFDHATMAGALENIIPEYHNEPLRSERQFIERHLDRACSNQGYMGKLQEFMASPLGGTLNYETLSLDQAMEYIDALSNSKDLLTKRYANKLVELPEFRDSVAPDLEEVRNSREQYLRYVGKMQDRIDLKLAQLQDEKNPVQQNVPAQENQTVYDNWFKSFEQQMKNAGVNIYSPTALSSVQVENDGKLSYAFMKTNEDGSYLKARPEGNAPGWIRENMQNFRTATPEMKRAMYQMAKEGRLIINSSTPENPDAKFVLVSQDGTASVTASYKDVDPAQVGLKHAAPARTRIALKARVENPESPEFTEQVRTAKALVQPERNEISAEMNAHLQDYHNELVRLQRELSKSDSSFSKDTHAYKDLAYELKSSLEYLGQPGNMTAENMRTALNAVNTCCRNYLDAHKSVSEFSSRQMRRMNTMHKLMTLNDKFSANKLQPGGDIKADLAQKLVVNGAIASQGITKKDARALQQVSNGRKCLLDHNEVKDVMGRLEETPVFKSFLDVNRGRLNDLLKTKGKDLYKQYLDHSRLHREVHNDMVNNVGAKNPGPQGRSL